MAILEIGGVNCQQLTDTLGTPLLVYDEQKIEQQLNTAINQFQSKAFDTEVVYAAKAFSCKAMFEKIAQTGASLDVVSGGELYCAHQAGVDMDKIYFHGNNKTEEELNLAFELKCKTLVLDNLMECRKVIEIAEKHKQQIEVLLRVNPGIEAHTHDYIMTAKLDSKFGISIEKKEQIAALVQSVIDSNYVTFKGFHSHIGSQITETEAFEKALDILLIFMKEMDESYGIHVNTLSIGGGFGIKYIAEDKPLPLGEMCSRLIWACETLTAEKQVKIDKLIIEPGRSIVGEAGYSLYTVGYSKDTVNKHYVFVDGGMSDNIRPALYQAEYSCDLANKLEEPKTETVCVAGKNCESGDILIQETQLQKAEQGDLLVMYATGAYGYSMASNYNRAGKPAVVFAKDGNARIVMKRETYEDLLHLETDEQVTLGKENRK